MGEAGDCEIGELEEIPMKVFWNGEEVKMVVYWPDTSSLIGAVLIERINGEKRWVNPKEVKVIYE